MRTRNPNSIHQTFMAMFFGKDASKYTSDWSSWPEPQRSIYGRMLSKKLTIVPWNIATQAKKALDSLNVISDYLDMHCKN